MFDKFIKMDISFYYNNENKQVKLMNYIEIETLIIHSYSLGVLVFFLDTESAWHYGYGNENIFEYPR